MAQLLQGPLSPGFGVLMGWLWNDESVAKAKAPRPPRRRKTDCLSVVLIVLGLSITGVAAATYGLIHIL